MIELPNELAPCGIYCGACPSFNKSCLGCSCQSKEQKRISKWNCKIRRCCYENKQTTCIECEDFPCNIHRKKLLDSHPGDPRFAYRHEIAASIKRLNEVGLKVFLEFQEEHWICPHCEGQVWFYHYRCGNCGKEITVNSM